MTTNVAIPLSLPGFSHPIPPVLWTVDDIREARPDLTARQAWEVFKLAASEQDARIGVTWDLLMYAAGRALRSRRAREAGMSEPDLTAEGLARRLANQGYLVIVGWSIGCLWVRNADMTNPPFVDEEGFVSFAHARKLCEKSAMSSLGDLPARTCLTIEESKP